MIAGPAWTPSPEPEVIDVEKNIEEVRQFNSRMMDHCTSWDRYDISHEQFIKKSQQIRREAPIIEIPTWATRPEEAAALLHQMNKMLKTDLAIHDAIEVLRAQGYEYRAPIDAMQKAYAQVEPQTLRARRDASRAERGLRLDP